MTRGTLLAHARDHFLAGAPRRGRGILHFELPPEAEPTEHARGSDDVVRLGVGILHELEETRQRFGGAFEVERAHFAPGATVVARVATSQGAAVGLHHERGGWRCAVPRACGPRL